MYVYLEPSLIISVGHRLYSSSSESLLRPERARVVYVVVALTHHPERFSHRTNYTYLLHCISQLLILLRYDESLLCQKVDHTVPHTHDTAAAIESL